VRVVRENSTRQVKHIWHLHPRDTHGVLLAAALRADHDDNGAWAGAAWREDVGTNTRVVRSILGVSLASEDPVAMVETYTYLGFRFGPPFEDGGDSVRQATTPRGSFLQVRSPSRRDAPSTAWLERRGSGLYHLAFADDLGASAACERMGVRVARRRERTARRRSGRCRDRWACRWGSGRSKVPAQPRRAGVARDGAAERPPLAHVASWRSGPASPPTPAACSRCWARPTQVEPEGGDPARHRWTTAPIGRSPLFLHLNAGKRARLWRTGLGRRWPGRMLLDGRDAGAGRGTALDRRGCGATPHLVPAASPPGASRRQAWRDRG
jgi:hypothetical protein